ncbi:MAG: GatB/YqeY domain-containing protein [Sphingobacteriales bacterium JAD_PAG50586_3]|nr:MAG: GatB/YqeY domain-containing protein [Sphingobacteriales bacterium JAD_PAG50586_3]
MTLAEKINADIKTAMLAKDKDSLDALRAVKSALLLAQTEKGASEQMTEEAEIKLLQKLVKQRRESAEIYVTQGRDDLAKVESLQADVIERYLPAQMSREELTEAIKAIIAQVGATGPQDMGKVMGVASKQLAGKSDNKAVSEVVKSLLQ